MKNNYRFKKHPLDFLRKFWILSIFFVFAIQANAQCPTTAEVEIHSLYDLQQFWDNYPNCRNIPGVLRIGHLGGDYDLTNNDIGNYLSRIESVGGLKIYNTPLTTLSGLSSLTTINGVLDIRNNDHLINISFLNNVDPNGITELILQQNYSLYTCTNSTVCAFMQTSKPRTISNNQYPCNNNQNLTALCLPPCEVPTYITSSNIAANKATIGWTSSGSTFDIEWGTQGFSLGSGTRQNGVSGTSYEITGLSANTSYHVYVRQNCTANQSSWVIHTFSTISCGYPNSVSSSNITQNSATINWSTTGTFDLEWGTAGFTQGTGTTQNAVSDQNYQITGLSLGTTYDVYVRQNCTPSYSNWFKHTFSTQGECPNELVYLYSMTDINNFVSAFPNCTQMSAGLWIQGSGITSLSALSNIQSIGGTLTIRDTRANMSGLSSLTSINGDLTFWENPELTNLDGLSSLTSINGKLHIFNNDQLTDISGVQNISSGITELHIVYNDVLSNCNIASVCAFMSTDGYKAIAGNAADCENVDILTYNCIPPCEVPTVTFSGITNSSATLNWAESGTFDIEWGVEGFTQGTGTTESVESASMFTFSNLETTTSYDVYIKRTCSVKVSEWIKETFTTMTACPTSGEVTLLNQQEVNNFGATYPNCTHLTKSLRLIGAGINDISSLSNLQSIGGGLTIYYTNLTNLDALENITIIGTNPSEDENAGRVDIFNNPQLTDISKLNFTNINRLIISYNQNLSVCNSENICIFLQQGEGVRNILSNASGCENIDAVIANCDPYCTTPHSITATDIVSDSALISWTNSGTEFEMEWGVEGFERGTGTTENNIQGTSYTVTGLQATTSYDVYIRRNCENIDQEGSWAKFTFSTITACPPPGPSIAFSSQQDVDNFGITYPNCVNLQGILQLGYREGEMNDIHDITPFSNIQSITGHLSIYRTQLTNLDALSNLTTINYRVVIVHNSLLTDISGIGNINPDSITDSIEINNNPQLAICNVDSICAIMQTSKPKSIYTNAIGCENVSAITASCNCNDLPTDITSVSSFSGSTITWDGVLSKYDLEWGTEDFTIGSGTRQSGVTAKTYVISGLSASTTYDVYVRTNCTNTQSDWVKHTFTTLSSACPDSGNLELLTQEAINQFALMYPNCTYISGNLYIGGDFNAVPNDINDISGLANIQSVGGQLYISKTQLTNLDGFSSITSINGYLSIDGNTLLTDISGLQNITDWTIASFNISGNTSLNECNISNICSKFINTYPGSIINNGPDCFDRDVVRAICGYAECPIESTHIYLSSQQAVDNFARYYPNCTQIPGQLTINGTDITNLAALSNIQSVGGHFYIQNTQLQNLDDLSNLTSIGSGFVIYLNSQLTDISGLQNISLDGVTYFNITENPNLAFCNYPFICDYLANNEGGTIANNSGDCIDRTTARNACPICDPITQISTSNVSHKYAQINWENVSGTFNLEYGPAGFEQGTGTLVEDIEVSFYNLTELVASTTYDVYIKRICDDSQSIWVKHTFSTISICPGSGVSFYFYNQEQLDEFAVIYPDCTEILGHVGIYNQDITNLTAFSNIQRIWWGIDINNTSLTNLNDLTSLTNLGGSNGWSNFNGSIRITDNTLLTDVSIIQNIEVNQYFERIVLSGNTSLQVCDYEVICDFISNTDKSITIENNALGCENIFVIMATSCGVECPDSHVKLNSQSEVDAFGTYFSDCTTINGELNITGEDITDLTPLSNLETVDYLTIEYNNELVNLNGLSINTINEGLYIGFNQSLENINSLASIENFGGFISIESNDSLNDISGISSIDELQVSLLRIISNYNLEVCHIDMVCSYIDQLVGAMEIEDNADGCDSILAVANACGLDTPTCPYEGLEITSQEELNQFAVDFPNCEEIYGDVIIIESDVYDLSPLSNIHTIYGFLDIGANNDLESFDGLNNLVNVQGGIYIWENENLTDISALENIDISSLNELYIEGNYSLSTCNLAFICEFISDEDNYFYIRYNAEGCDNISQVMSSCGAEVCPENLNLDFGYQDDIDEYVYYYGSCRTVESISISGSYIYDLSGLSNITTVLDYLAISYCGELTSLEGLNNVTSIGSEDYEYPALYIANNYNLTDISALSSLTNLFGELYIRDNEILSDISALENLDLTNVIYLNISNNPELSVCSFPNICAYLSDSDNEFYIDDNAPGCYDEDEILFICEHGNCPMFEVILTSQEDVDYFGETYGDCTYLPYGLGIAGGDITDLSALSNIEIIGDFFGFDNTNQITNLDFMSSLTEIGGSIYFYSTSLENLDGLSNLLSVGGQIYISENHNLTDISGLQNADISNVYNFEISNNSSLSICSISSFCEYLSDYYNNRTIYGNGFGCEDSDAIENQCFAGDCDSYTIWKGDYWSKGEPDATKRVIVRGDLNLDTEATICSIVVESGVFSVNSGATLTVNGEIDNGGSANSFVIRSGANLLQNEQTINTDAITVQRETTIKHLDYSIWSSPVLEQKLKSFSPHTLNNRIRIYDTTDDTWKVVPNPETTDFASGAGYMFRAPNADDNPGTPYVWTGNFIGLAQNGDVTYNFDNAYGIGEYQSIGNPYPSNISYESLVDTNPGIGTIYFWTNSNAPSNGSYVTNNWAAYSIVGEAMASDNSGVVSNGIISVGQGFVAETNGTISEVSFNNQMRTGSEGVFFRTMTDEKHRLWLDLKKEDLKLNQILIGYTPEASNAFDFGVDAKLFNYSGSALYSLIDNNEEQLVIQGRSLPFEDSDIVPLGFRATTAGSYSVSLSNFDGDFADGQDIFLKDIYTNTTHNLKNGDYSFVTEVGTFENRFEVVYRQGNMSVENPSLENSWVVYKNGNSFQIQTQGFEMSEVMVYDMLGRIIYNSQNVKSDSHHFPTLHSDQILIVKIKTTQNKQLSKKVVN